MRKLLSIILLLLLLLLNSSIVSADMDKITVELSINCKESLRPILESYLKRDLRSIGDIDIVDEFPIFHIQIITQDILTNRKTVFAYSYTFIVTQVENCCDDYTLYPLIYYLGDQCGPNDLKKELSESIAIIDSAVFEPFRPQLKRAAKIIDLSFNSGELSAETARNDYLNILSREDLALLRYSVKNHPHYLKNVVHHKEPYLALRLAIRQALILETGRLLPALVAWPEPASRASLALLGASHP